MLQDDALKEPDMVPQALTDGDDDAVIKTVKLPDALMEPVSDVVKDVVTVGELENVDEPDDGGENVPDDDCDTERVLQGDGVEETEADPHGLADGDEDVVVGPDALADPLIEPVNDVVEDGVDDADIVNVVEIVVNDVIVPDPDCETVPVPQCDAL